MQLAAETDTQGVLQYTTDTGFSLMRSYETNRNLIASITNTSVRSLGMLWVAMKSMAKKGGANRPRWPALPQRDVPTGLVSQLPA